ncbi:Hypothetical protein PHPALM_17830 [Phytophthora palmivora]|uniref:Uncharacterized protein n=1 Tax=Phytophthora palmivora TaxID=4796 RepID=A0A2P4XL91_9STRA|nr:Hypothetical protein PHPALM_17830 [Phytophthora palmivora]
MERTLEDELGRVSEKERNLDMRILEITRLEARLHEALLQQELQKEPQEVEPDTSNGLDEREAVLEIREKKLQFSKVQQDEKEKHLKAKERVLNEQAAELSNFQARLLRKYKDRESADAMRITVLEDELRAAHMQQKASLESTRLELEDRCVRLDEREASIACRERATTAQAKTLEQLQRLLLHQREWSLMTQEDYLSSVRGKYPVRCQLSLSSTCPYTGMLYRKRNTVTIKLPR